MSRRGMTPEEVKPQMRGVINILFTPFTSATEIDEEAIRSNIRYMVEGGIVTGRGVQVIGGSIGEGFSLSDGEYEKLINVVVDEAAGRVPVCVGCIRPATEPVIRIATMAEEAGADCVMVLAPHYATKACSEDLAFEHYKAVAKAVNIGIMIYDNPGVTGLDMSIDLLCRLSEIDNIVALKETTGNMFKLREVTHRLAERFTINAVTYRYMMPFDFQLGVRGFNTMFSNMDPAFALAMYDAAASGAFERNDVIWKKLLPLYKYVYKPDPYIGITYGKEMARIAGRPMGSYERLPVTRPSEEERAQLRQVMEHAGIHVA